MVLPPAAHSHLSASRPTPLCLCLKFPTDFPFSPPLVYVSTPQLLSGHVLDGGAKPTPTDSNRLQPSPNLAPTLLQPCCYVLVTTYHSPLTPHHAPALCMEMLVEWQPQYGNIEAMLVQICAFIGPRCVHAACMAWRVHGACMVLAWRVHGAPVAHGTCMTTCTCTCTCACACACACMI